MIEDAKRSIAFLCPVCRKPVIVERTVFQLAAAGSRLPCPCGQSAVEVALLGDQVRLTVPCLFCEEEHTVTCSTAAFLQEKTLAFSCAHSGWTAAMWGSRRRSLPPCAGWKRRWMCWSPRQAPKGCSSRPGHGGDPGGTPGHRPAGRHLLHLRQPGLEPENQLQFGGTHLRPLRGRVEDSRCHHVRH